MYSNDSAYKEGSTLGDTEKPYKIYLSTRKGFLYRHYKGKSVGWSLRSG